MLLSGWVRPVSPVYSSPKSGSAAAATTPARLARAFDGQVLWRTTSDGTTEVVALRKGNLERYRVNDDGTATLVDSSSGWFNRRKLYAMLAVGALLFVGGGLGAEGFDRPPFAPLIIAGWLLWCGAIVFGGRSEDLAGRAHRAYGGKGQWHAPTDLRDWEPRTAEQLAAVEAIADDHGGVAYVQDVGARTVDVVAVRKGRTERFWVDEHGQAHLVERSGPRAPYVAERVLGAIAVALWLGLLAVFFVVDGSRGVLIALIVGTLVLIGLVGSLMDPESRLAGRLKRGPHEWIEIRTKEPDGGD